MALVIAAVVFVAIVALGAAIAWQVTRRSEMRTRLAQGARGAARSEADILRPAAPASGRLRSIVRRSALPGRLATLHEQAGKPWKIDPMVPVAVATLFVAVFATLRTGNVAWGLLAAPAGGAVPVLYLAWKRSKRTAQFEAQFPEALDTVTRSVRAGYALSGALQVIAEELPDPVAGEFRRVFEEIRLGADPSDALSRLEERIPTEDVRFFATAVRIQRTSGGNLAEILERLAEVIRERFKLLSHARVLSSQHRMSAVCLGLSPLAFAVIFQLVQPGYFEPMLTAEIGPLLIAGGLVFEAVGFFVIWRIAQIKV